MKKYLLLLTLLFGYICTYAQHISFMGIQLGQSVSIVDRSLREKGFWRENTYGVESVYMYSGEFWKYKKASIIFISLNGKVDEISVYPAQVNPSTGLTTSYFSKEQYNDLIKNLTKKYGKYSIKKGLDYTWKLEGGEISASYEGENIMISYIDRDKIKERQKRQKRNKDNDL